MNAFWQSLHFLRPEWLWALLLVPLAAVVWWLRQRHRNRWREAVDPHLLPHLLVGGSRRSLAGFGWLALGIVLAALALAGPSWRQVEQPLWQSQVPLVLALDLSSRTGATDLPPSRLLQARAKLATLLRERRGGEVALVVYAEDAFTVAPLTEDTANVVLFLDALALEVMPVDGQRADRAIAWATGLLRQTGARRGDIVLLTDQADAAAHTAAAQALASGYRVSVLGLGTAQGAAFRTRNGGIGQARLDETSLRALANAGGGRYAKLAAGDADLQALDVLQPSQQTGDVRDGSAGKAWRDDGYWLLPALMLLGLLAFRRRGALAVLALACLLPASLPAQAAETSLWRRADQARQEQLAEGVAAYRKGDFAGAQRRFEGIDDAPGWYNLGNALARQGRYDDAIDAYDRALQHQPGMPDALANREAVEAARRRQSQQPQGQGQPSSQGDGDSQAGAPDAQPQADEGQDAPSSDGSSPDDPSAQERSAGPGLDEDKDKAQPPQAEDAQAQEQADQAQRERMQQAMQQGQDQDGQPSDPAQPAESAEQRERRQAVEAWMRRVPDDPGSLLKTKFQLEHERRRREGR
ncbi:tetratricopeptide repeat protein [Flavobacterium sp. MXW15]|uniref:Tetratricopeptide repeat protein n=1 Tax=Xanthomonas chitinilytica TaxID=2989819 RepID=A0ABT3JTT8_9XANT|nr:tetratricopeptide repeat protein [Xanthomonas sp. H13-6]MCW4454647.1 tetratricopeptide repeat protein [Flavobacterium sp. MXW15]MCW4471886.1 tetratricopeptide repeat protein [Xanthomonas sp. H13-6]